MICVIPPRIPRIPSTFVDRKRIEVKRDEQNELVKGG